MVAVVEYMWDSGHFQTAAAANSKYLLCICYAAITQGRLMLQGSVPLHFCSHTFLHSYRSFRLCQQQSGPLHIQTQVGVGSSRKLTQQKHAHLPYLSETVHAAHFPSPLWPMG